MAKFSGRRVAVGIGLEVTPGTPVAPVYWYPQMDIDYKDVDTPIRDESSRSTIIKNSGKDTVLIEGDGSISGNIYITGIYYWLALVFGQEATTTEDVGGDTGANSHLFELLNTNEHLTGTLAVKDPVQSMRFPHAMPESFTITWAPGEYPKIEIPIKSIKSATTANTIALVEELKFLPKHASLKIADALAGLTAASALTDIKSFSITFTKTLSPHQTMDSGNTHSRIFNTDYEVSGSIEKLYSDTTYKGYALNDTVKAMRFAFIDTVNKAGTTTPTSLTFDISAVSFDTEEPSYGQSDISTETLNFNMNLDQADNDASVTATLVNDQDY
jgi:hypothetical protein